MPRQVRRPLPFKAQSRSTGGLAVDIVKAFNNWSFKREQPSDPRALEMTAETAICSGTPVRFIMYWGKGPRNSVGPAEAQCLAFWETLATRINAVYSRGASLTLLLTDTHAQLNGHSEASIERYFSEVSHLARAAGHATERLSQVVSSTRQALSGPLATKDMPAHMRDLLQASAAKWYHGSFDSETAAKQYFLMNMEERDAVEFAYSNSIFVTFNNSQHRHLFPQNLPIFYMYSVRKGCAVKPWLMDNDRVVSQPHTSLRPDRNH